MNHQVKALGAPVYNTWVVKENHYPSNQASKPGTSCKERERVSPHARHDMITAISYKTNLTRRKTVTKLSDQAELPSTSAAAAAAAYCQLSQVVLMKRGNATHSFFYHFYFSWESRPFYFLTYFCFPTLFTMYIMYLRSENFHFKNCRVAARRFTGWSGAETTRASKNNNELCTCDKLSRVWCREGVQ